MVEIMKKKFDQDLFLNLWCDSLGNFAKMNSTLGSVVPLAMFTCVVTTCAYFIIVFSTCAFLSIVLTICAYFIIV